MNHKRAKDIRDGEVIVDATGRRWTVARVQKWRGCSTVRLHLESEGETKTTEDNTGRLCYAVEGEPADMFG